METKYQSTNSFAAVAASLPLDALASIAQDMTIMGTVTELAYGHQFCGTCATLEFNQEVPALVPYTTSVKEFSFILDEKHNQVLLKEFCTACRRTEYSVGYCEEDSLEHLTRCDIFAHGVSPSKRGRAGEIPCKFIEEGTLDRVCSRGIMTGRHGVTCPESFNVLNSHTTRLYDILDSASYLLTCECDECGEVRTAITDRKATKPEWVFSRPSYLVSREEHNSTPGITERKPEPVQAGGGKKIKTVAISSAKGDKYCDCCKKNATYMDSLVEGYSDMKPHSFDLVEVEELGCRLFKTQCATCRSTTYKPFLTGTSVFDRYSNAYHKEYFDYLPGKGQEGEIGCTLLSEVIVYKACDCSDSKVPHTMSVYEVEEADRFLYLCVCAVCGQKETWTSPRRDLDKVEGWEFETPVAQQVEPEFTPLPTRDRPTDRLLGRKVGVPGILEDAGEALGKCEECYLDGVAGAEQSRFDWQIVKLTGTNQFLSLCTCQKCKFARYAMTGSHETDVEVAFNVLL